MDIKEKRKQYYINNRDRIIERNKQYYYDNLEERKKYNYEYWSVNGHKYIEERKEKRKNKKFKIVPNIIVYFN
jgi:hypothetical protein